MNKGVIIAHCVKLISVLRVEEDLVDLVITLTIQVIQVIQDQAEVVAEKEQEMKTLKTQILVQIQIVLGTPIAVVGMEMGMETGMEITM